MPRFELPKTDFLRKNAQDASTFQYNYPRIAILRILILRLQNKLWRMTHFQP